jgi:hypothetical protein
LKSSFVLAVNDVVNVQVVVTAATRHLAPFLVAVEDLAARRRWNLLTRTLHIRRIDIADPLRIALRALDRRRRHLLDRTTTVLPTALALRAQGHRYAVRSGTSARAHRQLGPTWD